MSYEEKEIEKTSNYTWNIPSISFTQCKLCVTGYIRNNSSQYVPSEIIILCIHFFTDTNIMNKIKHSPHGISFKSDIFCINTLKFCLQIWPNGYNMSDVGILGLCITLVSLSNKISRFTFQFTILIQETNTKWTSTASLDRSTWSIYWTNNRILTKDIQNIDSLTIEFNIDDIISVFDDRYSLLQTYTQYQNPSTSTITSNYEWNINNKQLTPKIQDEYCSPYFKMNNILFYLKFKPNHEQDEHFLFLNILTIPPNISKIFVYCSVLLKQNNETYSKYIQFTNDLSSSSCSNIEQSKLHNIDKFDEFTFKLEIIFIDLYSIKGKPIKNNYLNDKQLTEYYIESEQVNVGSFSYLWQLPSILHTQQLLLITGYLRQLNDTIDHEILWLCQTFFVANTIYTMSDIYTAQCGKCFNSKIFILYGLKWCLTIFPNGDEQSSEGFVQFYIDLISISPNITTTAFNYNIELLETNTIYNTTPIFTFHDEDRSSWWPEKCLNIDRIKQVKQLTFKLNLNILALYKKDGTVVTHKELNTKHVDNDDEKKHIYGTDSFEWVINDAKTVSSIKFAQEGDEFCSDFFRLWHLFIWCLEFYPLGMIDDLNSSTNNTHSQLFLTLAAFPPNISSIAFKYKLCIKQTKTTFESFAQFDAKCTSIGWPASKLKHTQLQYFDNYTITVTISLIDIYDIKGNIITKEHIITDIERPISVKSEEYIWRIDDINIINLWKTTPNIIDGFKSNIFMMHGFEWFMEVSANGTDTESIGSFNWYLNLLSLSNKIKRITFYYNILLEETKTIFNVSTSFDHEYCSEGWGDDHIKRDAIKHLKSFTFKLNIKLFDVFDIDNNIINNYSLFQSPIRYDIPPGEFTWK
eukprot:445178_1